MRVMWERVWEVLWCGGFVGSIFLVNFVKDVIKYSYCVFFGIYIRFYVLVVFRVIFVYCGEILVILEIWWRFVFNFLEYFSFFCYDVNLSFFVILYGYEGLDIWYDDFRIVVVIIVICLLILNNDKVLKKFEFFFNVELVVGYFC